MKLLSTHLDAGKFGTIEFRMTKSDAQKGYHPGNCDEDVAAIRKKPYIKEQISKLTDEVMEEVLIECGIEYDQNDRNEIVDCFLWVVAGDIFDR